MPSLHLRIGRVFLAALALAGTVLVGLASPAVAATGWTSLSSGDAHTCGIRLGRIYCWGDDSYGQLGDGTAGSFRAAPAPIASGASNWTSVSVGGDHTCATRNGRIACWGYDKYGQLGDGSAADAADPTPGLIRSGATNWKSVSAGERHTCAIRAGRVACWGFNGDGELGDGTTADRLTPKQVASGASDWTSVSAGYLHTCAIRAGRIACWGNDELGQLGDGSAGSTADATPGLIASGASNWTSVSAGGFYTCATRAGRVACWGYDGNGQLGDGSAADEADPTPGLIASGATDWKKVDTGFWHTCAIRATVLACWGKDEYGQVGDGTPGDDPDPTPNLVG